MTVKIYCDVCNSDIAGHVELRLSSSMPITITDNKLIDCDMCNKCVGRLVLAIKAFSPPSKENSK